MTSFLRPVALLGWVVVTTAYEWGTPPPPSLSAVTCPATQTTFLATTEMVFESTINNTTAPAPLVKDEVHELMGLLRTVYNDLAASKCDSYFRRIQNLTMVEMEGNNWTMSLSDGDLTNVTRGTTGEDSVTTPTDDNNNNGGRRRRSLQDTTTTNNDNINATQTTGRGEIPPNAVGVIYEVVGTCRECPITDGGVFELYDDSFRRRLLRTTATTTIQRNGRHLRLSHVTTRIVSTSVQRDLQDNNDNSDCQCREGRLPLEPAAPGVQECVDRMNEEIQDLQQTQSLYQGVVLTDLLQLDDLEDDAAAEESIEPATVEDPTVAEQPAAPSWGYGDLNDNAEAEQAVTATTYTKEQAEDPATPSWGGYGY